MSNFLKQFDINKQPWLNKINFDELLENFKEYPTRYKIRIYFSGSAKQYVIDLCSGYSEEEYVRLADELTVNKKFFDGTKKGLREAINYCASLDKEAKDGRK